MPRAIATRLLNRRATVLRPTTAHDGQGGHEVTLGAHATDVPCRVRGLSARERTIAMREEVEASHRIYFKPDADVQRNDVVRVSLIQTGTERDLRIVHVGEPSEQHHLEVDAQEIRRVGS